MVLWGNLWHLEPVTSVTLPELSFFLCSHILTPHLKRCSFCDNNCNSRLCLSKCSDYTSGNLFFFILVLNCYTGYMILILRITSSGQVLALIGLFHTYHHVSKNRGYMIPVFFPPGISFSPWSLTRPNPSHLCRGYVEDTGIYDGI
jgi:hypothetical protein